MAFGASVVSLSTVTKMSASGQDVKTADCACFFPRFSGSRDQRTPGIVSQCSRSTA
jgi:hypothetical protein